MRPVYLAGGEFYTSGLFWAAAGVIAVLVSTAATLWVTLRAANPKRRLLYSMPPPTPLINGRSGLPQNIEVRRDGHVLVHPHVVDVVLASRGRRDIAREAFDGGEPLRLDVGAPILECLSVATSPPDRSSPAWKTDGSALLIGPSHIGRRQTTVFSLLVDGPSPKLGNAQQSILDVDIRQGYPDADGSILQALDTSATGVLASIAIGAVSDRIGRR